MPNELRHFGITETSFQGIYEESSVKYHPLGTGMYVGERLFRYCKAAEALTKGYLCTHFDGNAETLGSTSSTILAAAIGDQTIVLKNKASITDNEFGDGYFIVTNSSGEGELYKVREHDASGDTGASNRLTLTLYDQIRTATTLGSSRGNLVDNKYVVQIANASSSAYEVAVCVPLLAITSAYYFWGQTSGPCLLRDATTVTAEGAPVVIAVNSDGRCAAMLSTKVHLAYPVGVAILASRATTEWGIVDLRLE